MALHGIWRRDELRFLRGVFPVSGLSRFPNAKAYERKCRFYHRKAIFRQPGMEEMRKKLRLRLQTVIPMSVLRGSCSARQDRRQRMFGDKNGCSDLNRILLGPIEIIGQSRNRNLSGRPTFVFDFENHMPGGIRLSRNALVVQDSRFDKMRNIHCSSNDRYSGICEVYFQIHKDKNRIVNFYSRRGSENFGCRFFVGKNQPFCRRSSP